MLRTKHSLVLASTSKARENVMRSLQVSFSVMRPTCDEDTLKQQAGALEPASLAAYLAASKAASVSSIHHSWLVIGADQVCELDGIVISKSKNMEEATRTLRMLSGKTHHLHSAIALVKNGETLWQHTESIPMQMRTLSDEDIAHYIALDQPFSSCGAYMLEGYGKHLFSHVGGTQDSILGLPSVALLAYLYDNNHLQLVA